MAWHIHRFTILALLLSLLGGCQRDRKPVVVLAAASLTRAFSELQQQFNKDNPRLEVRLETGGSQELCRKVAELNDRADVVATADYRVIENILLPHHATYNIKFTTNEVVLAHLEHSKYTAEVTAENWPAILLRPDVRLGTVDRDLAPIGYATLLVWKLAELHLGKDKVGEDLAGKLLARCEKRHIMPDESELLKLLESKAIDYAFMYRSTAEEHRLKKVELPDAYNLGATGMGATYGKASVSVKMKRSDAMKEIRGAPITYGVTIPAAAPNPEGAALFVRFLLSDAGRATLKRTGFRPLNPAACDQAARLPAPLKSLVR
jgi:molybdate/tungstate transport system substrate-binding protein